MTALIIAAVIGAIFLIYLFLIMPRMLCRPSYRALFDVPATKRIYGERADAPPLYAHRGLHDNATDAPENSMAAFRKAVDAGFGMELDVQITKDGKLVIFHDDTLTRMTGGKGIIRDYTREELQRDFRLLDTEERIPSFEDFLAMVDGKVPLIIEIKDETKDMSICPLVDAALQNYPGVYCIESFNPLAVRWYKKHRPDVIRGQLSDAHHRENPEKNKGFLYFAMEHLFTNFLTKPDFIAYNHKYAHHLSLSFCRGLFHALTVAWTIKSEEDLARNRDLFQIFIFDSFLPEKQ